MKKRTNGSGMTVGLDLGDRFSHVVILDGEGQVVEEGRVATRGASLRQRFSGCSPMRIALETGMQFTELRRSQARAIVTDLVAQGHLARDQMGAAVDG